jgi:hypothetical protein
VLLWILSLVCFALSVSLSVELLLLNRHGTHTCSRTRTLSLSLFYTREYILNTHTHTHTHTIHTQYTHNTYNSHTLSLSLSHTCSHTNTCNSQFAPKKIVVVLLILLSVSLTSFFLQYFTYYNDTDVALRVYKDPLRQPFETENCGKWASAWFVDQTSPSTSDLTIGQLTMNRTGGMYLCTYDALTVSVPRVCCGASLLIFT